MFRALWPAIMAGLLLLASAVPSAISLAQNAGYGFFEAFGIVDGDPRFHATDVRIRIW